jgi:hypothetical protein
MVFLANKSLLAQRECCCVDSGVVCDPRLNCKHGPGYFEGSVNIELMTKFWGDGPNTGVNRDIKGTGRVSGVNTAESWASEKRTSYNMLYFFNFTGFVLQDFYNQYIHFPSLKGKILGLSFLIVYTY